jgi:hypothetical protein
MVVAIPDIRQSEDVTFQGVCITGKECAVVPAYIKGTSDIEKRHTVVFAYERGTWSRFDIEESVVSAVHDMGDRVYMLCRNGDVYVLHGGVISAQAAAGVEMAALARVENRIVACGVDGRVSFLTGGGWQTLPQPVQVARRGGIHFAHLAGVKLDNLWAVGLRGAILHWNGSAWQNIDSPTNMNFYRCQVVNGGNMLAAGRRGAIIEASENRVSIVNQPNSEHPDIWGLCVFGGKIYVSSMIGLFTSSNQMLNRVDLRSFGNIDTHFLDAGYGQLWSVGNRTIMVLDDSGWRMIPHPVGQI